MTVNIVHLCGETRPEDGGKPLEWFLLTALPVEYFKQAVQIVAFYPPALAHWGVFKILKSGGKVEYLSHRSADRIGGAVTIKAVFAWRLATMTMPGRETPELDASVLFSDLELMVLEDFAEFENLKQPTNLGNAMPAVAIMCGCLNRKNDRPPGYKLIWKGITELTTAAY